MNYLSHFFFDHQSVDPYFTFGSVLPDFADHFPRTMRHKLVKADVSASDSVLKSLLSGVNRHYAIDRFFHDSEFFKKHTTLIKTQLVENEISNMPKRQYMVAHVMLEIMLDRMLLKQDSTIGEKFYNLLQQVETPRLENTLLKCGTNQKVIDALLLKLQQFIHYRYLLTYTDNESLIYALHRIYKQIDPGSEIQPGLKDDNFMRLEKCIQRTEENLQHEYRNIFTEIELKIKL